MDPSDFASRSEVVLSLLLNAVAYKLAAGTDLPDAPYSTTFDEYMSASITFLMIVFMENAIVGWPTRYESLDAYGAIQLSVDHVLSAALAVRKFFASWSLLLLWSATLDRFEDTQKRDGEFCPKYYAHQFEHLTT